MKEIESKTSVTITLKVKVPTEKCQEVSQRLCTVLEEMDVFNGTLQQSQIELDID